MRRFAETAEAIAATSSKLKKIGFLADYLRTLSEDDLLAAAVFFTGKPFALRDAGTLNVGWSALVNAVQDLSGGIWQALICTAAGLAVAIPCYAAYNYLVSRVNAIVLDMEKAATEIINIVTELPAKAP